MTRASRTAVSYGTALELRADSARRGDFRTAPSPADPSIRPGAHPSGPVSSDVRPPLFLAAAPYDALVPAELPRVPYLAPGTVLIAVAADPSRLRLPALKSLAEELRPRTSAPLVLSLPATMSTHAMHLVARVRQTGFNGVVPRGQPLREALTQALTYPGDLTDDWIRWLQLHHPVPLETVELLRQLVDSAPDCDSLAEVCEHLQIPSRTLTDRLRRLRLPKLERWFQASRFLHAEREAQRNPSISLEAVATRLGYADAMSYSSRYYRMFGVTAAAALPLLGLEWRLARWWGNSAPVSATA